MKHPLPDAATTPDLAALPRFSDRRALADLVTRYFFPVSHRTLEAWPLTWHHVNGRAVAVTAEGLAFAEAMMQAAPAIRGGRRRVKEAG